MPKKLYVVKLTDEERKELKKLVSNGIREAKKLAHARILLKADEGLKDKVIVSHVGGSLSTVERIRKRFVLEGLDTALNRKKTEISRIIKIDGEKEAHLIALACSTPPEGLVRWSLRLLAGKMVELEIVDSICHETVRKTLKKMNLSPGLKNNG